MRWALIALAAVAGATLVWAVWAGLSGPTDIRSSASRAPALQALARQVEAWHLKPSGTASEHLEKGRALFLEDREVSYRRAQEELRQALALDPQDLEAAALYVEAFASGRMERLRPEGFDEVRELSQTLVDLAPRDSLVQRARARLLLLAGETSEARSAAEVAARLSPREQRAEAMLVWAQSYLETSAAIALEKVDEALSLDPGLKRAYLLRAVALERAGRLGEALSAYEKRLALDGDDLEALWALARIHLDLRDKEAMRKAVERFSARQPKSALPKVLQARWLVLVEKNQGAGKLLEELDKGASALSLRERLELDVLQASRANLAGDPEQAHVHAAHALALHPAWAPAHFQALLAALALKHPAQARLHLRACAHGLDDPSRAQEYLGRIEALAGNADLALRSLKSSIELAPQRLMPRFTAAALLVAKGDENGGWRLLREAMNVNPSSLSTAAPPATEYFEAPAPELQAALKAFAAVKGEGRPLAEAYSAVLRYHLGEIDRAARELDRLLEADPTSLPALLYRAQVHLDRRQPGPALAVAKRAAAADLDNPVAPYLIGRALEGLLKKDEARAAYLTGADKYPSFAPFQLRLGLMAVVAKQKEEALVRLERAAALQPEGLEARTALLALGR